MTRPASFLLHCLAVALCGLACAAQSASVGSITGQVGEPGIQGATIFLCDAKSGLPLDQKTHQQFTKTNFGECLCTRSDAAGRFCFTNIPPGSYRLLAQSFRDLEPAPQRQRYVSTIPPTDGVELH